MENVEDFSRSELLAELKKSRKIIADYKIQLAEKVEDKAHIQNYLTGLIGAIPDLVFVLDEQGTYLDYKTGRTNQLIYQPDQFIGKKISDLFDADYVNLFLDAINKVLKNGKEQYIQYELDVHGSKCIYECTFSSFESGKVIAVARDISDRKNIEINFQESQNKYRELLDLAPDMFFQGDENGNILECNQKAISTLGYERNEMIGSHISRFFEEDSLKNNPLRYDRLSAGEHIIQERILVSKGGKKIPVEMNSRKMADGTYQTFIRDISERRDQKLQLQQANNTLKGIFDTVSEAIYVIDETETFIEVNRGACVMYGYSREQLIGQSPASVAAPGLNDMEWILQQHEITAKTGKACQFEFWAKRSTGEIFPKEVIVNRGTFYGKQVLIATSRDVTAKKRIEKHIRESEKKYRQLFEKIRQGVLYHDANKRIIQSNPAAQLIFGLSENKLNSSLLSYETCAWVDEKQLPLSNTDYPGYRALKTGIAIRDFVMGIFNPIEKRYRWLLVNAYPEFENGDENAYQVHVSFTDITTLKETEKRLEQSEETYRNLFQNAQVGLFRTRKSDGKIIESNDQLALMFGYENRESFVKEFHTIIHYVDEKIRQKIVDDLEKNGEVFNIEAQFYRKDKTIFWANYSAKYYPENQWIEGVAEDITKRKITEYQLIEAKNKAEESDRLKSAFLANVSHEIRTPMNGILGFTQILQNGNLEQNDRLHYLDIIEKSANRLLETVNNLMDISKIETGQVPLRLSNLPIEEQLKLHFQFFQPQAIQKSLPLRLNIQLPDSIKSISTDVNKFDSIVINLLKNAIKYTSKGYVELGCFLRNQQLVIYVKDTGLGIPEHRQKAVFNRFEQADVEDRMAMQGTGLGLAIAKAYVEMLEGKIWLESRENEGTTFFFELPLKQPVEFVETLDIAAEEPVNYGGKSKMKILIAEDDPSSAIYLEVLLRSIGAEILFARTGAETVEIFHKHPDLNLVLMDLKMPNGTGLDATREIRKLNTKLPVIAQTAYAMSGDEEQALAAGCNAYITKPVRRQNLMHLIQQVLS